MGGVALVAWLARASSDAPLVCNLRRLTGIPCPTCGGTRAAMAAADGRFADAFTHNPFLCVAVVAAFTWLVVRIGFGQRIVLSRGLRAGFWSAAAVLFAANWAYLIWRG
ncbi:MAG: DUF2752 domain-containing protein [Planctomycetes bacterium]|nr:DUF2752 domain-containing protein [Planctomycetota bacterium]